MAGIPWLWVTIAIAALVLMLQVAPFQALLPGLVEDHFHRGSGGYGAADALLGRRHADGSLALRPAPAAPRARAGYYLLWALNDLAVVGVALSPWSGSPACCRRAGRGVGFGITAWETMLMELVPENRLSRVISLDFFGSLGLMPVGYALGSGRRPAHLARDDHRGRRGGVGAIWLLGLSRRDVRAIG